MLEHYIKEILKVARQGDAREESYYSTFETLIKEYATSKKKKDIHVTSQPKKTEAGNPDFRIWDGKQEIVGYIEAKPPNPKKQLEDYEDTEQLIKYRTTFPNVILTNFFGFRLYRKGLLIDEVEIADSETIHTLKGVPPIKNKEEFENLLDKFLSFAHPKITSAQPLAIELAKKTRFLRNEVVAEEMREEERNGMGKILGFYEAFQKYLIKGLTKEEFADLYSQTITYGLFASRMRCEGDFNRKLAVYNIPHSIGILREMFDFISLGDLPPQLEWIVDEISDVLANVDVKKIFSEYYHNKKGDDPVLHFYETFLAEYDPKKREQRGVYYTPEPVVSYIVRSIHILLKEKFGLEDGLADPSVTILDPAGGTLTFIAKAIKQATIEFISKYGEGGKEGFIREHILKNFYAFELMIAPYAIGHLKISFLLEELGYKLQEDERIKFYITNTLEKEEIEQTALPGMVSLSEESGKAGEVKKRMPILVILGNPPYSSISANMGDWITGLINDYKYVNGKHFGEIKHWLHDDYVKFIRFAEWKISQSKKGIIGYITNHGYLDYPTFRGMRQHLTKSFNEAYILDLYGGGSSERPPSIEINKDENVFDITKGVSISFFVKKESEPYNLCKIYFSEKVGLKEKKYEWLSSHNISNTQWEEIHPSSPSYLFIPMDKVTTEKYNKYCKITEIFPVNGVGFFTARDKFIIGFDKETLKNRLLQFFDLSIPTEELKSLHKIKDYRSFKIDKIRRQRKLNDKSIVKCIFRPFDERYVYYEQNIVQERQFKFMHHMSHENLGLITARSNKSSKMDHFFCCQYIMELKCGERTTGSCLFPLYVYVQSGRKTNINTKLFNLLVEKYSRVVTPEEIFYYIYAVFYSNIYRERYTKNLRLDFPRVPFTTDYELFNKIGKLGEKLVELHLMKSEQLINPIAKFQGDGDNTVKTPKYNEKEGRGYINGTQYFKGIEKEVWEYSIGGYQVLNRWIKYRKGEKLTLEDIKYFCKVVTVIARTIKIQEKIDELYPDVEKEVIEFIEKPIVKLSDYSD